MPTISPTVIISVAARAMMKPLARGRLRIKKDRLVNDFNPEWKFLNEELLGEWPPTVNQHRGADY